MAHPERNVLITNNTSLAADSNDLSSENAATDCNKSKASLDTVPVVGTQSIASKSRVSRMDCHESATAILPDTMLSNVITEHNQELVRTGGNPKRLLQNDGPISLEREPEQTEPFIRHPVYPITETCVCFGWRNHPANLKWFEMVNAFTRNTDDYPDWVDDICDIVKHKLAQESFTTFLVSRDSNGRPCEPVHGLFVEATDDELLEVTKLQFNHYRRHKRVKGDTSCSDLTSISSSEEVSVDSEASDDEASDSDEEHDSGMPYATL